MSAKEGMLKSIPIEKNRRTFALGWVLQPILHAWMIDRSDFHI